MMQSKITSRRNENEARTADGRCDGRRSKRASVEPRAGVGQTAAASCGKRLTVRMVGWTVGLKSRLAKVEKRSAAVVMKSGAPRASSERRNTAEPPVEMRSGARRS